MKSGPIWVKCPHCKEFRDVSNRYTSPANAEKDAREWKEQHESGACIVHAPDTQIEQTPANLTNIQQP